MKTVLVTGVAGRIGANLAVELLRKGYKVRGLIMPGDPKASKVEQMDIEMVVCDLRDTDGLLAACKGVDAVCHLAAAMGQPAGMSDRDYFDINVTGTWNVVYGASKSAPNLQRFVFAGTDFIYGSRRVQYLPVDEKHPHLVQYPYGMVKILGEDIVNHFRRQTGMPVTITRFGTVMAGTELLGFFRARMAYGTLKEAGVDPLAGSLYVEGVKEPWKAVEEAVNGNLDMLFIPRNMEGVAWTHNITDVRDSVQGVMLALEKEEAIGETFNIHDAGGTPFDEAVLHIHERTGEPYAEARMPNYLAFYLDISKARRMLGYNPQYHGIAQIDQALDVAAGKQTGVIPT
jgi:UDP-glucose 4-epimerase